MTERYFIAIPESTEPPQGPFTIKEVLGGIADGKFDRSAHGCRVGSAAWFPIDTVLPPPAPPAAAKEPDPAASDSKIAAKYGNLSAVSDNLVFFGLVVKVAAFLLGGGGVIAAGVAAGVHGALVAPALALTFLAIPIFGFGVLLAAIGEALLALRDIAVNTARGR